MTSVHKLHYPDWRHDDCARSLHDPLNADMNSAQRHDNSSNDDVVDVSDVVVHGFLPGEEGETEVSVSKILHLREPRAEGIRHNGRFDEKSGQRDLPMWSFLDPSSYPKHGEVAASNHKIALHNIYSQSVIPDGFGEVNSTREQVERAS